MAILTNEPNEYGISGARSPIFYKYTGCDMTGYTYQFDLLITGGTKASLTTPYVSIIRTPDNNNELIIDASILIKNFIKNNLSYEDENVVYIKSNLYEFTSTTTGTTTSNVGIATMGYTLYTDGFNYTDETSAIDYIMNYYLENKTYQLLNYNTGITSISWRDNDVNTGYLIEYTNLTGGTSDIDASFGSIVNAADEVKKINFSYADLSDLDNTKPIYVNIVSGTTVVNRYKFITVNCNGNDVNYLKYINKWGVWDRLYFTGRDDVEMSVDYETYKYNDTSNFTYNTKVGSTHKYLNNGTKTVILNTGFVDEVYNDMFNDLMLSEYVILNDTIPVIIIDKDIRFKKSKFEEKLINYTITVEYAFNEINNII